MKITSVFLLCLLAIALICGGCVSTTYYKTVEVRKDPSGNIIETKITESIMQPNQSGHPVTFEYLQGIK